MSDKESKGEFCLQVEFTPSRVKINERYETTSPSQDLLLPQKHEEI